MLSGLSDNARSIVIGIASMLAAFFVFRGSGGGQGPTEPLDAVPRASFLVGTVDVTALRRSPIYEAVLGKDEPSGGSALATRTLGLAKLKEACGFDPLGRVDQLAIAVPEEGDSGELGVAARIRVTNEEVSRCANTLASTHGGQANAREVLGFAVVEDSTTTQRPEGSDATGKKARLGYGHGLLVVSGGAWFDAMLESASGKQPNIHSSAQHESLRASLTGQQGWRSPTILVTALLPRSLRDRLKREMDPEAEGAGAAVMAGVLGVSAVGVALRAGGAGERTEAAAELVCDDEPGCAAVEKLILKQRLAWSKELSLRMVGLGPLLDSVEVKRNGTNIRVTAGAVSDALAQTIERILRFKARTGGR